MFAFAHEECVWMRPCIEFVGFRVLRSLDENVAEQVNACLEYFAVKHMSQMLLLFLIAFVQLAVLVIDFVLIVFNCILVLYLQENIWPQ